MNVVMAALRNFFPKLKTAMRLNPLALQTMHLQKNTKVTTIGRHKHAGSGVDSTYYCVRLTIMSQCIIYT